MERNPFLDTPFFDNSYLSKEEESPLDSCKACKEQPCIKTGKICDKVEKLLKKITTGRRNWQTTIDPAMLETYTQTNLSLISGKNKKGKTESLYVSKGGRKTPHIYGND